MSVRIVDRIDLPYSATAGATSTIGEPSVAEAGDEILYTGNWYAAESLDRGRSWTYRNPATFFPPVARGFCCDQTTLWVPSQEMFVWTLQYQPDLSGNNAVRLAVRRGGLGGKALWLYWDMIPAYIHPAWRGEWFDFGHIARSDRYLYLVANMFRGAGVFLRSVAFRIPLDQLRFGSSPRLEWFTSPDFCLRATQGAEGTMYFGVHRGRYSSKTPWILRVYRWPEADRRPSPVDLAVRPWVGGSGYVMPDPQGRNWMGRCDARVTGGWVSDGVVGFTWTADRHPPERPQPYVRTARIDEKTMTLLDQPDLWQREVAFGWSDAGVNGQGEVGISLFFGGPEVNPSHAVGVWNDAGGRWDLAASRLGASGPVDGTWGDYVSCRPSHEDPAVWVSSGYVLDGGGFDNAGGFDGGGSGNDVRPFLVHHRRSGSAVTAQAPPSAAATSQSS